MVPSAGFGEAEVFDFAGGDEVPDGSGYVFNGHFGVDAVLVEEIDAVGLEALEGLFADLLDVLGFAVEGLGAGLAAGDAVEAELGGDNDLVAVRREGFADEDFVGEGAVDFGGVEEGDAEVDGFVHEVDHFGFVVDGAVAEAHAHAAEAEG